jgi:tetratricopeptide (TPR) repeat protein
MHVARRAVLAVVLCSGLLAGPLRASQGPAEPSEESPDKQVLKDYQAGQQAEQEGDQIRADSDYRQALGQSLIELGLINHTLGNLDQAILAYQQAVKATANSDVALLGLAIVYLRKAEFDKGIETVKILLAQNPFNGEARYLLGKLYFSTNRFADAKDELQNALRVSPQDYGIAYTLAMADLKLKDLAGAQVIFQEILAHLGDSPKLRIAFAAAYRQTEYFDEALKELQAVLATDPSYPRLHYYLAVTDLGQFGRPGFPKAIEQLKTEIRYHPRDYESNYLLGMLYVEEHQMKDAVPYLEAAVRIKPDSPDSALYLGQTYELLGRYTEAIPLLQKSIKLTHDPSRNNYQIANTHYLLGQALLRTGHSEESKQHFAAADKFKNFEAVKARANLQAYLGLPGAKDEDPGADVEGLGGKAIIVAPPPPTPQQQARLKIGAQFYSEVAGNAYNQLGLMHARQSDFKKAAEDLEGAAQWEPGLPGLAYNLGLAEFKAGNFAAAVDPLVKAESAQPDRANIKVLLGMAYFFNASYQEAVGQLGPLAKGGVQDPEIMYALGLSLAHIGQRDQGERMIRSLVAQRPQVADSHQALGEVLAMKGDFEDAAAEFTQALQLDPKLPQGHYDLGLALLRQSKFADAVAELQQAAAQDPHNALAEFHLGLALSFMDRLDEALQHLDQSTQLDPSFADAYYEIGKIRMRQAKTKEALAALEKAAQIEGNKSYIQYELSQAYFKDGQVEAAQSALSRYRTLKAQERKNTGMGSTTRSPDGEAQPR